MKWVIFATFVVSCVVSSAQVGTFNNVAIFGPTPCVALYGIQTLLDLHSARPSMRIDYIGGPVGGPPAIPLCANAPRAAGFIGMESLIAGGFLTGLSKQKDFLIVANDTARHIRIANNNVGNLEDPLGQGNICFDLTPTLGTQVNRMTLWPHGRIDFNVGNWNCQAGKIRFEGESWDGSSPNVDDPVIKLYRPTGTVNTCPDPLSFTWWIQNAGHGGGYENSGALQFRAYSSAITMGNETPLTMETRVTFLRNGKVGINTMEPYTKLHMVDGTLLCEGSTGITPVNGSSNQLGAGTRLMWIPAKGAFRAGIIDGTQWNNTSIGTNSWAGGQDCVADASQSIAVGDSLTNHGENSAAFGYKNIIASGCMGSLVFGDTNRILYTNFAINSLCGGYKNLVLSPESVALGVLDTASGPQSFVMGYGSHAKTSQSFAHGLQCVAGNPSDPDSHCEIAMGHEAYAIGPDAIALGRYVSADGYWSTSIGSLIENTGDHAILIGKGISNVFPTPHVKFVNFENYKIKMGLNSDSATLTITAANGTGTFGNVGVGTAMPTNLLAVAGRSVFGSNYATTANASFNGGASDDYVYVESAVIINTLSPVGTYSLEINGDGFVEAGGIWTTSDSTLKRNIVPCQTGLQEIRQIAIVNYEYKDIPQGNVARVRTGVLAQNLEKVLPNAVRTDTKRTSEIVTPARQEIIRSEDPNGVQDPAYTLVNHPAITRTVAKDIKAVSSDEVLYTLVNAVKELANSTDSIRATNRELRLAVDSLHSEVKNLELELNTQRSVIASLVAAVQSGFWSDGSGTKIFLDQNQPNPFSGFTDIIYEIDASLSGDFYLDITNVATATVKLTIDAVKGERKTERIDATGWTEGAYIYCIRSASGVLACKKMCLSY